jgi:trk system potassium uptake protein TrkA
LYIVIVGGSGVGFNLSQKLVSDGHKVTVIEKIPKDVEELKSKIPEIKIIEGDGSKLESLRRSGLGKADLLILLTGLDEKNLSIGLLAKNEFKVPRVVSLVNDPKHEWLFDKHLGIDNAIDRATLMVEELTKILKSNATN